MVQVLMMIVTWLMSLLQPTMQAEVLFKDSTFKTDTASMAHVKEVYICDAVYIQKADYINMFELKQVIQQRESRGIIDPKSAISPCGRYVGKYQIDYYLHVAPKGIAMTQFLASDSLQELYFDAYMVEAQTALQQAKIPVTNATLFKSWTIGPYWFTL
jgi:hypothetical protein